MAPLPFLLPADSLIPGAKRAQADRCAAVGNRVMSIPISAMITCAAVTPIPVTSSRRSTARAKGRISSSILPSTAAMVAPTWSIRPSMVASRNA